MTQGLLCLTLQWNITWLYTGQMSGRLFAHANNNFTVRHSKGFCLPVELPLLTSREKFITAEPRHFKMEIERVEQRAMFLLFNITTITFTTKSHFCILFNFLHPLGEAGISLWVKTWTFKAFIIIHYQCLIVLCSWTRNHRYALLLPARISCVLLAACLYMFVCLHLCVLYCMRTINTQYHWQVCVC